MKKISAKTFNIIRIVVLCAAAIALIYASYSLTDSYLGYKEDEAKYAEIDKMFEQTNTGNTNIDISSKSKKWSWDYKAMMKYNDESVGYIKLDNSRIQYPIVWHEDNKFYLTHGSDKVSNGAGSIFVDYRTAGLNANGCIVYGHNMLDGSMFADLMKYRKKKFAASHKVFDLYIGYRHYKYYVFSAFSTKKTDESIYKFGFKSDADFLKWIAQMKSKSSYKFKTGTPGVKDKVILLSTCVDDYGNRQLVAIYRGEEVVD